MEENYEEEYHPSIHEVREWRQMALETFTFTLENNKFDEAIERLINLIKEDKKGLKGELKKLPKSKWKFKNLETYTPSEADIDRNFYDSLLYEKKEELKALVEMKIIYAFKTFEINLKKILTETFYIKNKRDLFQWDKLIDFIDNKGVQLGSIKGYQEINQLRQVNNSIKHSEKLEEKTLKLMFNKEDFDKIPIFPIGVGKLIGYEHLLKFYNRIEPFIIPFLKDLCNAIYNELYVYDEEKLESVAEDLVLKMDKKDAFKLIEKIKNLY